ncbi:MAG: glycosyltransferase family 4 protein [Candidatus Contendobacter sp.]|nr:glycosyltransferase family 4 protein [Candidatus Contendobacter sp.]MDG4558513.1 glycosyltransferase family 4 protein [Candidatus Contendobacter sp.]
MAGYHAVFLGERAKTRTPGGFWSLVCPEVWREVRSGHYDALILHGHNYAVNLLALLAAKTAGVKVFMRGETHLGLQRSGFKQCIRRPLMNLLYRACDRCLAIGTANRAFYQAMGVPEHKIVTIPYAVDNDRFIAAARLSDQERRDWLQRLGADTNQPVVLYASKFQRRKHPDDLLKAVTRLRERGIRCTVLMVGSGEMQDELRQLVTRLNLSDVHFTGFINQSDLPRIYGASDIFVLPSENEPWGLIVNEVMCAALPVVISKEVGCVPDLVREGDNGFLFQAGDIEGLARALEPLLTDAGLMKRMGQKSRERIEGWSYAECLQGLRTILN